MPIETEPAIEVVGNLPDSAIAALASLLLASVTNDEPSEPDEENQQSKGQR